MKPQNKKSVEIGTLLISAYIINYVLRNLLGVLTPELLETACFSVDHIATLSSAYMFSYAIGQLINGFMGDAFSPKKISVGGIALSGTMCIVFVFSSNKIIQLLCFILLGFALSMLRGPFMKIISENTASAHARIICVFLSFSSFAGPLAASLLAMLFDWKRVFISAGIIAIVFAVLVYTVLTVLEHKKQIIYNTSKAIGFSSITDIFKIEKFLFYLLIGCLGEVTAASISFWIPTYLTDYLSFGKDSANLIFSVISVCRAFMPFVTLFIFRLTKENDIRIMRVGFMVATCGFFLLMLRLSDWVSICALAFAMLAISCVNSLLWSIYIPSLGKTGRVSSANGVLDCSGYIAAGLSNIIFAKAMVNIGWNGVFVLWTLIGVIGCLAAVLTKKKV